MAYFVLNRQNFLFVKLKFLKFGQIFHSKMAKRASIELILYPSVRWLRLLATQAYCVKCKAKREMKGEKQVTMKNGRNALSGTCSVCGTKMFKIGGGSSTTTGGASKAKPKKAVAKAKAKKGGKKKK